MADKVVTSFAVPNYSGMLFNKGNARTPFSTMIGGRRKSTTSVEFVTGQEYETGGGVQPDISEAASLTAPDANYIKREQKTNVTQIFQKTLYVSYAKESNMGTLAGVNIGGQTANPGQELAFQAAAIMQEISRDMEYTFVNGVYQKATNDSTSNKTRGIMTAIATNVMDLGGAPLRIWDVANLISLLYDSQSPTSGLVLWLNPTAMFQLNADAEANGLTVAPAARNINGISISTILTPLGEVGIYLGEFLKPGEIGLYNFDVISPVEQPTPGKGNFFREELAKTGAGTKYQIYGQIGLDYGPEWFHGKIINASPDFIKPQSGKKVYIESTVPTTNEVPALNKVTISGTPKVGVASTVDVEYIGNPTDPTLTYKWKRGGAALGTFTDISGAASSTYTPIADDNGKFIKCEVTAAGAAEGVILSNSRKVTAADAT